MAHKRSDKSKGEAKMKNLAPKILRQRLLIEGFYAIYVNEQTIGKFFENILEALKLKAYGNPTIY